MSRARIPAAARAKASRVAPLVRLRICANVFARSAIHFDAGRAPPAAGADECARRDDAAGGSEASVAAAPARIEPDTVH